MDEFMRHPFIQTIADEPRWTVSDKDKRPINMWKLILEEKIRGAFEPTEECLCTLHELIKFLPNRANQTFYLCAVETKFAVLDVEPDCPEELKQKFLQMPYLYGEKSMSGKGLHLVFPLPENYMDYPVAFTKPALKNENKWYEILLNHYCAFTGNMIPPASGSESFNELFYEMAAKAKPTVRSAFDASAEKPKHIPDKIIDALVRQLIIKGKNYAKKPADFGGDISRYEYCLMGSLYNTLVFMSNGRNQNRIVSYSDSDKAWLMYTAAQEVLPHRLKHDEERDGLPWLLYLAREFISKVPKKEEENSDNTDRKERPL